MSNVAVQSLLVAVGGLGLLAGVFLLARRGLLYRCATRLAGWPCPCSSSERRCSSC